MATYYGIRVDGGDFITEQLSQPLDLDRARQAAMDLSEKSPDEVVSVVSRSPDPIGGGWQDCAAAFLDGVELERSDPRYPA
jgi:hypothetical protein